MIYPIVAYGDPVLRKRAKDLNADDPNLPKLIEDMFETMYHACGVGLAAPQIGKSLRLFVVDAEALDEKTCQGFKKVFINPEIIEQSGQPWDFEEGCLSIPNIRENVRRQPTIKIKYFDQNWQAQEEVFDGLKARVIQHEYDHIEGVLFTDKLSALKKRLLKGRLANISKGKASADYPMRFLG